MKIPGAVIDAVRQAVNAEFKLIRYILPSQLLAKLIDPARNALALQAGSDLPGSFDARSFCKDYITPFDQDNHRVLGGSEDPGVGNLWRSPQIDESWLNVGQRRKKGGQALFAVLSYAQEHPKQTELLLLLTLSTIADRLTTTRIIYPRPNRIALETCESLISQFLTDRTGGRRLQLVAAALFDSIGIVFRLFDEVRVGHINKSDAAREDVGDLECIDTSGHIVYVVEVKDKQLSVREVEDTMRVARDRGIAEVIYAIRGGVASSEVESLRQLQARQFTAGHNIYQIEFSELLRTCLILFAEKGRLTFLERIGIRVDEAAELSDRQAWQAALTNV